MSNWQHSGKSTTERGYGHQHQKMREHLKQTVILCEACRAASPPRTRVGEIADHIRPLSKGGTAVRSNYMWLCKPCAQTKDAKDRGKPLKVKHTIGKDGWPI